MTVSGPTLIAALLMGDPLNKLKTLDEITGDLLKTFTIDLSPPKKAPPHANINPAMISGPSGSFAIRESGSKTRSLTYYDNQVVKAHAEPDSNTIMAISTHSNNSVPNLGSNMPADNTSFQSTSKHALSSPEMNVERPLNFTAATSSLTSKVRLELNSSSGTSELSGNSSSSVMNSLTTHKISAATNADEELQIAIEKSLETKEAEDIKRATELSELTKTEGDNLHIAKTNSLETKEAEDIRKAIDASLAIPVALKLPENFFSTPIDPLATLRSRIKNNKKTSQNKIQTFPKSLGLELFQALAHRNKSMPIVTETSQIEEHTQKAPASPKSKQIAAQTKIATSNKVLSEKALKMQAFAAQSAKQQGNTGKADLLSLIQAQTLKTLIPQAPKTISSSPDEVKNAVINTLHSIMKTGKPILKKTPEVRIQSATIKTLDELKAELEAAKTNGTDKFTLRALQMQIQELESTSQKIERDQMVKDIAASHQVKKVELKDQAKARSIQIQNSLKKADPSKDDEIRQRILTGKGRLQKLAEIEKNNAQALDKGTLSYEGPLVTLATPLEVKKNNIPSIIPVDQPVTVQTYVSPEVDTEPTSTAPQATKVTTTAAPTIDGIFGALASRISQEEKQNDTNTTLTKENVLKTLTEHRNEIGLSDKDLETLKTQSLKNLQFIIDEFYNEEDQEWDLGFADQTSIMSRIKLSTQEETKPQLKTVGRLNIKKDGNNDLLASIRAARGTVESEDTVALPSPGAFLPSLTAPSEPPLAPKPPVAPKVLSAKAQEVLAKLSQKKEEAKVGDLLDQIRNKDLLIKLKSPTATSPETTTEKPTIHKDESLEDVRNSALAARRRSMEIDNDLDDDWDD